MNAIWREESVLDPLLKAVLVDGVAEVHVGVAVVLAQRRRRHPKLIRWLEVLEDLPPGAFVPCASPMALIHDDEIEEIARVLPVEARPPLIGRERLVDGEV